MNQVGSLSERVLCGHDSTVDLSHLTGGSCLGGRLEELRGRSVLVSTGNQLRAAITLIELDGIARRLVLCPADLHPDHVLFVMNAGEVDAIVSDFHIPAPNAPAVRNFVTCSSALMPADCDRRPSQQTEWVLLTSGTTGAPKLVVHTLTSLAGAIELPGHPTNRAVWSTFYDIRRYGGLQIFLRAAITGTKLVLSSATESPADYLARAGLHNVTHISGTPSHWRRALMSPSASMISPRYIRLSGEIADQAILSRLRSAYPNSEIAHAFASTEAGVGFDVRDGLEGFPASLLETESPVEMKVVDGTLRIRSTRVADRYLGTNGRPLRDPNDFVDTGDVLELRDGRYYFAGRRDGVINIGGLKVYPEEVEAVINSHPQVHMSLVRTRKNPITGSIVVADVLLKTTAGVNEQRNRLQGEILQQCRQGLLRHKVPAAIRFVEDLRVDSTGKLARGHA